MDEINFPEDPIVIEVQKYAKETLSIQTFNHCIRVFYFGKLNNSYPACASSSLSLHVTLYNRGIDACLLNFKRLCCKYSQYLHRRDKRMIVYNLYYLYARTEHLEVCLKIFIKLKLIQFFLASCYCYAAVSKRGRDILSFNSCFICAVTRH